MVGGARHVAGALDMSVGAGGVDGCCGGWDERHIEMGWDASVGGHGVWRCCSRSQGHAGAVGVLYTSVGAGGMLGQHGKQAQGTG